MASQLKFVLLEQSGTAPSDLSLERRASCEELGISYFRLNWNPAVWELEDSETLLRDRLTWSEGRSALFAVAQKADFDYLIFMDDDVRLGRPGGKFKILRALLGPPRQLPLLRALVNELARYLPLQATVYCPGDWAHRWDRGRHVVEAGSKPFRIAGHDLQVDIFQKAVASLAYPAPVAGSGGSMWFAHFVGAHKWPDKQIVIKKIWAFNEKHEPHGDSSLPQFERGKDLLLKTRAAFKPSFQNTWVETSCNPRQIIARNKETFKGKVNAGELNHAVEELWYEVIDRNGIQKLRNERKA